MTNTSEDRDQVWICSALRSAWAERNKDQMYIRDDLTVPKRNHWLGSERISLEQIKMLYEAGLIEQVRDNKHGWILTPAAKGEAARLAS